MRVQLPVRVAVACLAGGCVAWSSAQSLTTLPPPERASALAPRGVLFDAIAANRERARQQPMYVESIFVEGVDPDARRRAPKSVEQRFADALLAPPRSPTAGLKILDPTPCMSVVSTWNSLGASYAPLAGCP